MVIPMDVALEYWTAKRMPIERTFCPLKGMPTQEVVLTAPLPDSPGALLLYTGTGTVPVDWSWLFPHSGGPHSGLLLPNWYSKSGCQSTNQLRSCCNLPAATC